MDAHYIEDEVVARIRGLTVARLRRFTEASCICPEFSEGRATFSEPDLARLQLLCELVVDFDLDEDASALVLSLVDQIHGLRRELRALVAAIDEEPEDVRRRLGSRLATRGTSS